MHASFKGDPCLVVQEHKVKASMKSNMCKVQCAFTENNFVSASCHCKAGCENTSDEQTLCTHGLVPAMQLSQLTFESLAHDLLCDLRLRLVTDAEGFEEISEEERCRFRKALEDLRCAATKERKSLEANTTSLAAWLSDFTVGTDAAKKKEEPKNEDLGMLRIKCQKFIKPEAIAERIIKGEHDNDECALDDRTIESEPGAPDYLGIKRQLDALLLIATESPSLVSKKEMDPFTPIGFELLDHRLSKFPTNERFGEQHNKKVATIAEKLREAMFGKSYNTRGYNSISSGIGKVVGAVMMPTPKRKRRRRMNDKNDKNANSNMPKKRTGEGVVLIGVKKIVDQSQLTAVPRVPKNIPLTESKLDA